MVETGLRAHMHAVQVLTLNSSSFYFYYASLILFVIVCGGGEGAFTCHDTSEAV